MKYVIEGEKGRIELPVEGDLAFATSAKTTIEFDANPDTALDAMEYYNEQRIKQASNEAATAD